MAWTAPRTWVTGEIETASIMNTHVKDNFLALSQHTHTGAAGDGDDVLTGLDTLTFDDQAGSPSTAGRLQRNGTHLEWYNGTSVVVVTDTLTEDVTNSDKGTAGAVTWSANVGRTLAVAATLSTSVSSTMTKAGRIAGFAAMQTDNLNAHTLALIIDGVTIETVAIGGSVRGLVAKGSRAVSSGSRTTTGTATGVTAETILLGPMVAHVGLIA